MDRHRPWMSQVKSALILMEKHVLIAEVKLLTTLTDMDGTVALAALTAANPVTIAVLPEAPRIRPEALKREGKENIRRGYLFYPRRF